MAENKNKKGPRISKKSERIIDESINKNKKLLEKLSKH